jgi:hypothetical protein
MADHLSPIRAAGYQQQGQETSTPPAQLVEKLSIRTQSAGTNGTSSSLLHACNPRKNIRKLFWRGEERRMIGVDGKCLLAWRMLLHLPLQLKRNSAVALALNVIARGSTPALYRRFDWRSKRRAGLGNKA